MDQKKVCKMQQRISLPPLDTNPPKDFEAAGTSISTSERESSYHRETRNHFADLHTELGG